MHRILTLLSIALMTTGFTGLASADTASLAGSWTATAELPDGGTSESTLEIKKEGGEYAGTAATQGGETLEITGFKIDGKAVVMDLDFEYDGMELVIRVKAEETEKGKLSGKWLVLDGDDNELVNEDWEAVRTSAPEEEEETKAKIAIEGDWNAVASTNNGELKSVATFTKDGNDYGGKTVSERGENVFEVVNVEGKTVEIDLTVDYQGTDIPLTIRADLVEEDVLDGKWFVFNEAGEEAASGAWKASRVTSVDLTGTWDIVASTDDSDRELQSVFEKDGDGFAGSVMTDDGEYEYETVSVSGKEVKLGVPFGEGEVQIAAKAENDDKLVGKWTLFDSSGSEVASNDWVATRQVAPSVVGEWAMEITFGDSEPRDYSLSITEADAGLAGTFVSPRSGETACDEVSLKDDAFSMKVTREIQGNEIQFIYTGKLSDGKLSGEVVPKGYEDQFEGTWSAKPKE